MFSSLTVTAALASLLVFPQRFLVSMALGGILCTVIGTLVALLVLPATLALLGTKVNAFSPRRWQEASTRQASDFWYRLAHFVMRRAVLFAIGTSALLLALGLPFLHIKFI